MRDCPYLDDMILLEPILRFKQNEGLPEPPIPIEVTAYNFLN